MPRGGLRHRTRPGQRPWSGLRTSARASRSPRPGATLTRRRGVRRWRSPRCSPAKTSADRFGWRSRRTFGSGLSRIISGRRRRRLSAVHRRVCLWAARQGLGTPPSLPTFTRRAKEIPAEIMTRARGGVMQSVAAYPSQRRSVAALSAGESWNGDGMRHDVFVTAPDGVVRRPVSLDVAGCL